MATYITAGKFPGVSTPGSDLTFAEPDIGELRFIARLNSELLPNEEPFGAVSTTADGSAIEGSDVVSLYVNRYEKIFLIAEVPGRWTNS